MQTIHSTSIQSAIAIDNTCTVCGYQMEYPPTDYNICPSCGTEFEVDDVNTTIQKLREAWLETGPVWWSPTDPVPVGWDPQKQLQRIKDKKELADTARPFVSIVWDEGRSATHSSEILSSLAQIFRGWTSERLSQAVIKPDLVLGRAA